MKSRLPASISLTNRQRAAAQSLAMEAMEKQSQQQMRRFFKLMCATLNRRRGFGKGRCMDIVQEIATLAAEHATDEEFWYHLDRVVIDEIGMEFEREKGGD